MSDVPSISPLIQRLAIGRLVTPGCISRHELQRAHERFSRPPGAPVPGRLLRRAEFSAPGAAGLLLARSDQSLEVNAINPASADVATAGGGVISESHQRRAALARKEHSSTAENAAGAASSLLASRSARATPGITQAGQFGARKVAVTPGVIATSAMLQRVVKRAGGDVSHSVGIAPRPMSEPTSHEQSASSFKSRSIIERHSTAPRAAGPITPTSSSPPTIRRKADPAAPTDGASTGKQGSGAGDSDAPRHTLAVRPASPVITQRPIAPTLQRRAGETIVRSVEHRPHSAAAAAGASATNAGGSGNAINISTPLVLRKASAILTAPIVTKQSPTISAAPPGVIARTTAHTSRPAASERGFAHTELVQATQHASEPDIERIVEQVESRIARRIEIEHERQGVRLWRRTN